MDHATPANGIELVVFDIGGVMIRLAPPPPMLKPRWRDALLEIVSVHEVGQMPDEQFVAAVAEVTGFPEQDVLVMAHAWIVEPYPGIEDLVDELSNTPVRTACLSNTNNLHWPRMHDPGHITSLPLPRLDHRFASHLVGMRKPNEDIYRHVEQQTGVTPERIVFFDDNADNIQAARACGWQAVQIDPQGDPPGQARGWLAGHGVL